MSEQNIEKKEQLKYRMAICYDFDKTLSPEDMQTFTLIPSFGIDKDTFWKESEDLAEKNLMDSNLAWMYQLLNYSKLKRKPISKDYFHDIGKEVKLYNGVNTWFNRINKYAEKRDIKVDHFIISSGLKEIIEGSKISECFTRIYASSYLYSVDGIAEWPAQAINYTNKTQFIFRIAKGCLEEYDESVNNSMIADRLAIPYENIVYIGDSQTDIPCMRLVKSKGGYSIGVFDPKMNKRKKVYELYNDERINFYAPANYSARSSVSKYVKAIIDEISAKEKIKDEQKILKDNAMKYGLYKSISQLFETGKSTKNQKKKNEEILEKIKEEIEGDID